MKKVAVIGAGISGLTTAHFLKDQYEVVVFEKEQQPGGLLKCKRVKGSLFHTCGGHVFNTKLKDVADFFWDFYDQDNEFRKTNRNSVVMFNTVSVVPYPIEDHMYCLDKQTQEAFINDLLQIANMGGDNPRNFEEFLKGRFGKTLYELYFKPYNQKVWRRNLCKVPLNWLEGKLPMPTVKEMIYNNFNHVEEKQFVHSTFWYEKNNGSQYLIDKIADGLTIRLGVNVEEIIRIDEKWYVGNDVFDYIVYCGNIKDMVYSIKNVSLEEYTKYIDKLSYHGTTSVFCEIDKNPYSWIYLPSNEYESHRIICTGNFAASNNDKSLPDDRITATIEFTDYISKDDIIDNLGRIPLNPVYLDHEYNQFTYPIQDNNTRELICCLKKKLCKFNFYFTGRFADWEYYNMDVAINAAMKTISLINT